MGYPPHQPPPPPAGPEQPGFGAPQGPYGGPQGPGHGPSYPPQYGAPQPGPPRSSGPGAGLVIAIVAGALVLLGGIGVVSFLLLRGASDSGAPAPAEEEPRGPESEPDDLVVPEEYAGHWEGSFQQYDAALDPIGENREAIIDLSAGGSVGTGELYEGASHLCSWELTLVDDLGEDGLEFDLSATDQETSCVPQSTLFLVPQDEDAVELVWQGTLSSGEGSTAVGVLTRTG